MFVTLRKMFNQNVTCYFTLYLSFQKSTLDILQKMNLLKILRHVYVLVLIGS